MAYQQVLTTNNLENVTPGPKSQEFWQARKDALGFISANTVVSDNNTTTTLVWQSHDDYINFLRNNIDLTESMLTTWVSDFPSFFSVLSDKIHTPSFLYDFARPANFSAS